jgi:hypothetical protein
MLFINNNNLNCCLKKTFLFQKMDSNAIILGLKKLPLTKGQFFRVEG